MRMVPPEPGTIQPTADVFDALKAEFLARLSAPDEAAALELWARLVVAVGDECLKWFRIGEASGECDAYDRGKHDGEQEAWDAINAFIVSVGPACVAGTALDPRRAS